LLPFVFELDESLFANPIIRIWTYNPTPLAAEIPSCSDKKIYPISQMYFQSIDAWHLAEGRSTLKGIFNKWSVLLSILVVALFTCRTGQAYYAAGTPGEFSNLPVLELTNHKKLLVIAPHPDDETLAAGGVIQQAIRAGVQVKVVVATNGDGQMVSSILLNERNSSQTRNYVNVGEHRQAESIHAIEKLGLGPADMIFLGYPDRGTASMWLADWRSQCPYRSVYTRVDMNPYPDTYHTGEMYCGSNLQSDLQDIIENYKPDLVILPHPSDQHPDHEAVSNFARMAIAMASLDQAGYSPEIWAYLVHYGMFPEPRGKHPDSFLVPPKNLLEPASHWGRINLSPSDISIKYGAIREYSSQFRLFGRFLSSFVRSNELFEVLPLAALSPISFVTLPVFPHTPRETIGSGLPFTANEDYLVKGNMFIGWQTVRLKNILWLNLDLRTDVFPDEKCTLYVKLPNGQTEKINLTATGSIFSSRIYSAQVDLATLGNPSVLAFAAEVRQAGILLSKTGWHMLILN
jgi:LmbE family N-acetylglucosaminyl deacetylase